MSCVCQFHLYSEKEKSFFFSLCCQNLKSKNLMNVQFKKNALQNSIFEFLFSGFSHICFSKFNFFLHLVFPTIIVMFHLFQIIQNLNFPFIPFIQAQHKSQFSQKRLCSVRTVLAWSVQSLLTETGPIWSVLFLFGEDKLSLFNTVSY